jgi:hypothetical protein
VVNGDFCKGLSGDHSCERYVESAHVEFGRGGDGESPGPLAKGS